MHRDVLTPSFKNHGASVALPLSVPCRNQDAPPQAGKRLDKRDDDISFSFHISTTYRVMKAIILSSARFVSSLLLAAQSVVISSLGYVVSIPRDIGLHFL
jgi:hypothetical protein